mmetsp:Transcript_5068/g.6618  ORF Transcript_5068/g.6618 Transcript_5068/m.6618 type:complete len:177 (+) Transcript_5068:108-638(+)
MKIRNLLHRKSSSSSGHPTQSPRCPQSSSLGMEPCLLVETGMIEVAAQQQQNPAASLDVPIEFICPITLDIMRHPVCNRDGHTFERAAILSWLATKDGACPLTRKPMKPSQLISNWGLQVRIESYLRRNCTQERKNTQDKESDDEGDEYQKLPLFGFVSQDFCADASLESKATRTQ